MGDDTDYSLWPPEAFAKVQALEGALVFTNAVIEERDRRIAELEAENARLREESQWRPIETAPKDGTEIIAHGPVTSGAIRTATVMWEPSHRCWASSDNWPWEDFRPTNWRPLPPPPTGESDG